MSQQINTKIIPIKNQRYETLGDYFEGENEILYFRISDTGNNLYNKLILIHELIEQTLTEAQNIKEPDILAFDLWVEEEVKKGNYPDNAEPGEHLLSPYKKQHDFAMNVERQIMNFLNLDFTDYDNYLKTVFEK